MTKEQTFLTIGDHLTNCGIAPLNMEFHEGPVVSTVIAYLEHKPSDSCLNDLSEELSTDFGYPVRILLKGLAIVMDIVNDEDRRKYPKFNESVSNCDYAEGKSLPLFLGIDTFGSPLAVDLAECPHILVAGAAFQGQGVLQESMINSLLNSKRQGELKLLLADSKIVNLNVYDKLDRNWFYGNGILVSPSDVIGHLNSLCGEMDARYKALYESGCSSVEEYRQKHGSMPDIVAVIVDYRDYMGMTQNEKNSFLSPLLCLAQKGKDVGIHCIISTQRPDAGNLSGIVKASFPARIATRCTDRQMSKLILNCEGAERLVGKGDMFLACGMNLTRFQGLYVSEEDTEAVIEKANAGIVNVNPISKHKGGAEHITAEALPDEALIAARLIVEKGQASTAFVQRTLGWGYLKASRAMDILESAGIIGPSDGDQREILVKDTDELDRLLREIESK